MLTNTGAQAAIALAHRSGDLSNAVRKFVKVVLFSGGIAASGAVLKLGVRQAVTYEGLWPAVGGGLIGLGALLIIAALASRRDMPTP